MTDLPSGTVTFLFTDIDGSTKLAQQQPIKWEAARQRHLAILHAACEMHHGHVFQIVGDAFCVAFATAPDALVAAIEAQRTLQAEAWGETHIRVRMGLHTGAADALEGDYHGYLTMVRVQRVMSVAFGGQMLLSQTTADLTRDQLPRGTRLRDMGEHRLKGLLNPERLWQVLAPGLPQDFPPLQTLNAIPNNLPIQVTVFVGREGELAELQRLLTTTRLLTLTGSGGIGKTRLSLQLAAEILDQYKDGVWFVELAPLTDPSLVPQTVADVLGIRDEPSRPLLATLLEWLRPKQLMLILDNCEHLVEACARIADAILHGGRETRILASSREALGIAGELAWRVPSLGTPDPNQSFTIQQLDQYAAIRLFSERAFFAQPSFRVTDANAPAVAQICHRLDGIPLAIELAAARVKFFSAEQIASRLDDRFRLLTGGSRTAVPRQQTLRGAIDWSYSLLSELERTFLRRLSVFAGGWTFEATEAVCAGEGIEDFEVLDLLTHLVEKSLVVADERDSQARYRMLETIRQYAREKLLESGEGAQVQARHLAFIVRLAEEFRIHFASPAQLLWLNRLSTEQDNVRTAIEWALVSSDILAGLRIAAGLMWFWQHRYSGEGSDYLRELLARPEGAEPSLERARALWSRGTLEVWQGNYSLAQSLQQEALVIAKERGDQAIVAGVLGQLGSIARVQKQNLTARALITESADIFRQVGDPWELSVALLNLGDVIQNDGDLEGAQALYVESTALFRQLGELTGQAVVLRRLGQLAVRRGDYERASAFIGESLSLNVELGERRGVASCLAAAAAMAAAQSRQVEAARLYGSAASLLHEVRTQMHPFDQEQYERNVANLRTQWDTVACDAALAEGRALTFEQAVAAGTAILAESAQVAATPAPPHSSASAVGLTAREVDVLRLLAQGLTDAQIAETLVISTRTVNAHLRSIFSKLDVTTRTAAARIAIEHKII